MAGDRVRSIPSSVFTIIDLKYPNMLQSFGLIRSSLLLEFIYKRPAYYAVQHMMTTTQTRRPSGTRVGLATYAHRRGLREGRDTGRAVVVQ